MRFLHIVPRYYPYVGGSELYVQKVSEAMAARGHQVTVLTTNAWDLEYFWDPARRHFEPGCETHNGVDIVRLPVAHLPFPKLSHRALHRLSLELARLGLPPALSQSTARFWVYLPTLREWLQRNGSSFDLAHPNNLPFDGLLLSTLQAFRGGRPVVCTPHTHFGTVDDRGLSYYTMPHQIRALRRCSLVLAQTAYEAQRLAALGIDAARIRLAGVGVDPGEVVGGDGDRFRKRFGLSGFLVGFLGTAAFEKGAVHLLYAMEQLWRKGYHTSIVFVGPMMSDFERHLSRVQANGARALGFVDSETKRDFLAAIDVLAMPSRTEAFGIAYLEAWANGKPVIGARSGAVTTVIREGIDGLLVDFGDTNQLSKALEALIQSPELCRTMGESGRQRALTEYRWDSVIDRVRRAYSEALGVPEEAV